MRFDLIERSSFVASSEQEDSQFAESEQVKTQPGLLAETQHHLYEKFQLFALDDEEIVAPVSNADVLEKTLVVFLDENRYHLSGQVPSYVLVSEATAAPELDAETVLRSLVALVGAFSVDALYIVYADV